MKEITLRHISEPSWASDARVRAAFRAIALTGAGLSYPNPVYERRILPFEPAGILDGEAESMSSCALWVLYGIWLPLGVAADEIRKRYVNGMAVAWVETIARRFGAWLPPSLDLQVGQVLFVSSPEHEIPVIEVHPNEIVTVEGGKSVHGHAIERCSRLPPTVVDGKIHFGGRTVIGIADTVRFDFDRPAQVPDDFDEMVTPLGGGSACRTRRAFSSLNALSARCGDTSGSSGPSNARTMFGSMSASRSSVRYLSSTRSRGSTRSTVQVSPWRRYQRFTLAQATTLSE